MKKFFTFCFILSFSLSKATVQPVNVQDFEFNPAIFTVNVGDTIMWVWNSGFHTTSSVAIPVGAASWDQQISQATPMFMYAVTVAGNYDYQCNFHASMGMTGHFTAVAVTGIDELPSSVFLNLHQDYMHNLILQYGLTQPAQVSVNIYNIIGNSVYKEHMQNSAAGIYEKEITTADLSKGIYVVEINAGTSRISRKILIQ
jgi:plastocyanin